VGDKGFVPAASPFTRPYDLAALTVDVAESRLRTASTTGCPAMMTLVSSIRIGATMRNRLTEPDSFAICFLECVRAGSG
jgi:hypothetical protein